MCNVTLTSNQNITITMITGGIVQRHSVSLQTSRLTQKKANVVSYDCNTVSTQCRSAFYWKDVFVVLTSMIELHSLTFVTKQVYLF